MNNYLIIDTEEVSIKKIKKVLSDFPEFNCVGCTYDYLEPIDVILKNTPDLIFLNLDTVLDNPFNLVNEVDQYLKKDYEFIAISSSKEKTYEAIKTGFFDYLLNPITELDIRKAALKFKKKHSNKTGKTICLKSYKDYQYLNADEILFLKADNNTTDFYMNNGHTVSAYKTLKTFELILPRNFLRIHKSYIVNKNYVNRVNYGTLNCTLKKCLKNIPFSKTYINNVELMINALSQTSVLGLS
ncbi:LytTR family transcriptional regulator DNA-binding domain-containing protein [Flavivirga amylovorans]|uniref:LytTR family transcriptional regulator DNA-binding domain-containing protein n=1 Tax=Flavivirga amylovorans TaxID=870486 RepID=A0ABT8X4F6_9FLAO|nr:LytTR family transcriptional regulator DNA-binding domain-containing protein [Flavivirga amylovorans]MDO5988860.1 LytTR family transcriptional regulator DNA-binding domain-containing protein [Flavivirga amylovorans]